MLQYQGKVQEEINALNKTKTIAQQYLITTQEASSYVSQLLERERQEGVFQKAQIERPSSREVQEEARRIEEIKKGMAGYEAPIITPPEQVFYGPVPEGYSERTFHETGQLVPLYQGPVPKGYSLKEFSETGKLVPLPSGVISPYKETTPLSLGIGGATGLLFGRIGSDIKTLFSKTEPEKHPIYDIYYTPKKYHGIGGYLDVFKFVGKTEREKERLRAEDPTSFLRIGTTPPEEAPYLTFGELTGKQKLKYSDLSEYLKFDEEMGLNVLSQDIGKKISNELNTKYQEQINTKSLTFEQATIKFNEDFEKKYSSEYNKQAKRFLEMKKLQGSLKRTGAYVSPIAKLGAEMASLLHPVSAVGMGIYKGTKFMRETPYKMEKGGLPLYPEYVKKDWETPLYFMGAGLGALRMFRSLEKATVISELKQLGRQPTKQLGVYFTGREPKEVIVKGVKTFRGLKTEVDIYGKVYRAGEREFIMPSGFGEAKTYGKLSWNILGGAKPTYISTVQQFGVEAGGISIPISETGKLFGTIGVSKITPTEATGLLFQTKPIPKPYLKFPSPKIRPTFKPEAKYLAEELVRGYQKGGRITKEITTSKTLMLPDDWLLTTTAKKDIGLMKKLYMPKDRGVSFLRKADIKKTSLLKLYAPETEVIKQVFKPAIERVSKLPVETAIRIIPEAPSVFSTLALSTARITTPIFDTGFKDLTISRFGDLGIAMTRLTPREKIKEKEKVAGILKPTSVLSSELLTKPAERFVESLAISPRLTQKEMQKLKQEQVLITPVVTPTPSPTPLITPTTTGLGTGGFWFPDEKPRYVKQTPYDSFERVDATKEERAFWRKLNKIPLTRESAKNLSAETIDRSISARGKISPQKSKIVKGKRVMPKKRAVDLGTNYFEINRHKFRDWKQVKGHRTKTPNEFIEKSAYRQDFATERKELQTARRMSSLLLGSREPTKRKVFKKKRMFRL